MDKFKEEFFKSLDPDVSSILGRALDGKKISQEEALKLFTVKGLNFNALILVADWLRFKRVGDTVTFVCNRNINFTNVCQVKCDFCAFSRDSNSPEAYLLKPRDVAVKAKEAWLKGATEVCIQGGINPILDLTYYEEILREIKKETPKIHIHAFSPMEIAYMSWKSGLKFEEVLVRLKEAGLDSMPGTAAEILVDEVRKRICPRKIGSQEWIKIIKTAHRLGIPTTATIMYGHIERLEDLVTHLKILRDIQEETRGFTEFIPLTFVHWKTPLYLKGKVKAGATGVEDLKVYAISRLFFNGVIDNIQVSWVKLGAKFAQIALTAGANDFGGTLMEENISRSAGATAGENMPMDEIIRLIRNLGRVPAQRTTTYKILRKF
ncbi:7,8-didemethyl-8-hydroxy-5-deazariboflavin synthase subunit CofH [Candidatus Bathyarchaeota archaeon]|nr:MAG: 7,8-didemethyl-8-hydroxy-5-deazariboflavin synthase subunit CofH [Candidatus Bathyarchaeota archaeon]